MNRLDRRDFIKGAAVAGLTLAGGAAARAQGGGAGDWPNRPVRFIVPLAPGGAIDFIARQVGEVLTRASR